MEPMTTPARRIVMMSHAQVRRGLVLAAGLGLLCAVVAGCGSVVASTGAGGPASTPAGSTPAGSASSGAAGGGTAVPTTPAAPVELVGCASVDQATAVSITRLTSLVVPTHGATLMATDRKPAQVRALFRDFCDAVAHPDYPPVLMSCPADFGTEYIGVFYDGNRVLARYTYDASGCRRVALTVGKITQSTVLAGRAASAAPHLVADFAAILTGAEPTVKPTTSNQNKGGGTA